MLTQLSISQFAIVDTLCINFSTGMTAITGETGAGKSIVIDALNLCLGARADVNMIQHGQTRADITAQFTVDPADSAGEWLEYFQLDEGSECILRRVINQDGRSKAFINGKVVPISQLRELGQRLVQIHGQHEHQLLLHKDYQHLLLDHYIADATLPETMKQAYREWKLAEDSWQKYEKEQAERSAHQQLLQYQLQELSEFTPVVGEFEKINEEYKKLSNCEQLVNQTQHVASLLSEAEDYNVVYLLNLVRSELTDLTRIDNQLVPLAKLVEEAGIQISEASLELRQYSDRIEMDPGRLVWLEERMAKQILLARKYQVPPEKLVACYQEKIEEFQAYEKREEEGQNLDQQRKSLHNKALALANELHSMRTDAAKKLSMSITQSMQELCMPKGQFEIRVEYHPEVLHKEGADTVSFFVSTNAGQPLQPISRAVSGGELSRLALAIQVLTAQKTKMPVLIFDEIDVGISGSTAAKAGHLLRELGASTQVITVTHLPQVAGHAHTHLFVNKHNDHKQIKTTLQVLNSRERVFELARLLAGDIITDGAIANAKELLVKSNF